MIFQSIIDELRGDPPLSTVDTRLEDSGGFVGRAPMKTVQFRFQRPNFPRLLALPGMDLDQHAKSTKTLKDNQRWLNEHELQTVHRGDLPISEQTSTASPEPGMQDQQQ